MDNFKIVVMGIIFDPKEKKILIGKRKNDPGFPEPSWRFPGERLTYGLGLDKTLEKNIKVTTGYDVKNIGEIFSKRHHERKDLVVIYFLCQTVGGEEKAGGNFKELKWVHPKELESHFTDSFRPRLKKYLIELV